jgi:hypothetical protein
MVQVACWSAPRTLTVLVTQSPCHGGECQQLSANQEVDTSRLDILFGQRGKFSKRGKNLHGDELTVQAGDDGIRFLLVSGKPLEEPVGWYGPTVMNTQEQLRQAFQELERGTFLKRQTPR